MPAAVRYEIAVRKLHGAASAGAVRIHAHAAFGKCALYLFRLFVYKTVIVRVVCEVMRFFFVSNHQKELCRHC